MLTGFETAGLALAIFPLVIEGLKSYSNSTRTIKNVWRPEGTLEALIRELRMEKCKFENTLTSLLEGIVLESDLFDLINDPRSKLWYAADFQNTLRSRLRPATVNIYVDSVKDLLSALETLKDTFALGSECGSDDKTGLKKKWKMIRLVLSKTEYKEQLDRISKINSDLQGLTGQTNFTNIAVNNTTIAQAMASVKNYKRIRDHAMSIYAVLKEKLQPVVPFCQCQPLHNANLQLEMRNATFRQKGFGQNMFIGFHIAISYERVASAGISPLRSWRDLRLEPADDIEREILEDGQKGKAGGYKPSEAECAGSHSHLMLPPPMMVTRRKKPTFISSIVKSGINGFRRENKESSTISNVPETHNHMKRLSIADPCPLKSSLRVPGSDGRPSKRRKVSFPESSSTTQTPVASGNITNRIEHLCLIMQQAESGQSCLGVLEDKSGQYFVWPLISSSPPGSTELISLRSLLDDGKMLGKEDRLILGVQLASTVLQLHKTEWLSEDWSNEDIFFHQIDTEGRTPDIKRPFVRQSPNPSSSLLQTQNIQQITKYALIPHDQSLFSLGIVLMELWYGRPLEKLQEKEDELGSKDLTNFVTARRLASNISLDAGAKYGEAVRRCINGLDYGSGCLDADDLKRKAHMEVVTPLVESLEFFCGKDIGKIFPAST